MDNLEYKEKSQSKIRYETKEELRAIREQNAESIFPNEDISLKKTQSKKKNAMDSSLLDLNESVSMLDMSMITDEINWKETVKDPLEKKLSDKDFLLEEAFKLQEFSTLLDKTGDLGGNEILSSINQLLKFNSEKWMNGIGGVKLDENKERETIQGYMTAHHEVTMRLYELAQRYLETDKYWMTRSGYRRKDLCQKIVKWASGEDRLATKWESRLVSAKVNQGASKEFAKRNAEHFAVVKDRLQNVPGDETLPEKTRQNIHEIDTWILRHTKLGAGSDGMEELQASLMRLSTRERLYVYYLIETGKRKDGDSLDMAISQFDYVPNPEKFKSTMVSAKIWKGFSKDSRILWNKLSDAMLIIKGAREKNLIKDWEEISVSAKQKIEDSLKGEHSEENNDQINAEIEEKYKLRNDRMAKALKDLKAYKQAYEKLEEKKAAGKNSDKYRVEAELLYKRLCDSFGLLDEADKAMPMSYDKKEQSPDIKSKESIENQQKAGDGLTLVNTLSGGATAVDKATMAKDYVQWGVVDKFLKAVPMIKSGAGGLSALAGLTAAVIDFTLMIKLGGEINAPALAERIAGLGYVTSLTTTYAVNAAATTSSYLHGVPITDLTAGVTKELAILGGISAGIFATTNIIEHVGITKRMSKIDRAQEALEKRHKLREKEAENGKGITEKEAAEMRLENAIIKMEKRMEKTKRKVAWTNTSAAVLTAVAAIPVAGLGAALGGLVVTMGSAMAINYKGREKLATEVIDAYIEDRFQAEYNLRYGEFPENYEKLSKKEKAVVEKRKKTVENFVCASLGYHSREKLLANIQKEMALFLHNKLFINEEDGSEIYSEDLENQDFKDKIKPYQDAAYGLGLKVKYPHKPDEKGKKSGSGKPSARKIFLKMKF